MPPYKKQYTPRSKTWNKPYARGTRRGYSYGMGLKQLGRDVMKLKGLINVEFKIIESPLNSTVSSTGTLLLLNGIATGDTDNTREGNSIRLKSVLSTAFFEIHVSATATHVRRLVVIDKQPNEALATVAGILQTGTFAGTVAPRNLSNRKRFVIISDHDLHLSNTGSKIVSFPDLYKQIDLITIYDDSNSGGIGDIRTNALYVLYISSEGTNVPSFSSAQRVRFIDN